MLQSEHSSAVEKMKCSCHTCASVGNKMNESADIDV